MWLFKHHTSNVNHIIFQFQVQIVLKSFKDLLHLPLAYVIQEVLWKTPIIYWYKCNYDGAFDYETTNLSCGGIFRNSMGDFYLAYSKKLKFYSSFHLEIDIVIHVIVIANERGWSKLWIDRDSFLVVQDYTNPSIIPWKLRKLWKFCMEMKNTMSLLLTHIYKEGNSCVYCFVNKGLRIDYSHIFDYILFRN